MKVASRQNRATGETFIVYAKVVNQAAFRYCLLKNLIENTDLDCTILIDTNQKTADRPIEQLEAVLQQMRLHYQSLPAEANPKIIFGFQLPQNKKRSFGEHKIIFELNGNRLSKELFEVLKCFDISIGFGRKKAFEETCTDYRLDNKLVLFNAEYFEKCLYDSVVCESMRSSFLIEEFIRKAEYEAAV